MLYLILAAAIISSGLAGNVYMRLKNESRSPAHSVLFPAIWFLPLSLVFLFVGLGSKMPVSAMADVSLLVPGIFAGIGMALAASILIESMKKNSLSFSVILVNLNFVIPVILSLAVLGEKTGAIQLLGMILSIGAILWINIKKDEKGSINGKALVLPCIACIANGTVNFCIKLYQNETSGVHLPLFNSVMYLTAAVVCITLWLIMRGREDSKGKSFKFSAVALNAVFLGLCNGVCFYMSGLLAGRMNAAAQFTILTAASIMISIGVGALFQKESINKKSLVSFLLCLVAILCQASAI